MVFLFVKILKIPRLHNTVYVHIGNLGKTPQLKLFVLYLKQQLTSAHASTRVASGGPGGGRPSQRVFVTGTRAALCASPRSVHSTSAGIYLSIFLVAAAQAAG